MGFDVVIGDATRTDVLEHAGVSCAMAVCVTLPDPAVAQRVTTQVRALIGEAPVVVRSRYQRHSDEIRDSGATEVSDEEVLVGLDIAAKIQTILQES